MRFSDKAVSDKPGVTVYLIIIIHNIIYIYIIL